MVESDQTLPDSLPNQVLENKELGRVVEFGRECGRVGEEENDLVEVEMGIKIGEFIVFLLRRIVTFHELNFREACPTIEDWMRKFNKYILEVRGDIKEEEDEQKDI